MAKIINPTEIARTAAREVTVTWEDGHQSVYSTPYLREICGCAQCVDEWTGITRIVPGSIATTIDIVEADHVGGYAVRFIFTDGHSDGIYSWRRLREYCPCSQCAA